MSWQNLTFDFTGVVFDGGDFRGAQFSGGLAFFDGAAFVGGEVRFDHAEFSGGQVSFGGAAFSGGEVDFSRVGDCSLSPTFPWTDTPPQGVKLPRKEDRSQT